MSLALVINSEEQLRTGVPWANRLVENSDSPIHVIVVGTDRKMLVELARRRFAETKQFAEERFSVACVESNVDKILSEAQSAGCGMMLIADQSDNGAIHKELFEASPFRTIWIRAIGEPPQQASNVYVALRGANLVATLTSEKMFGFGPAGALSESIENPQEDRLPGLLSAIESNGLDENDLVLFGVAEAEASNKTYQLGLSLLQNTSNANIAIVHGGHSVAESFALRVHNWFATIAPPMQREHRIELANDLAQNSRPNLEFLGLMSASSMLAAFGLLQDSAAVIIGAMLIAPLMTPIMGSGMALAHGNRPLFQSSLLTITLGFLGALIASILFGWLFWAFQEPTVTPEMWARCRPSPLDFCVGLVGGIAASYARTRTHLSSALAGAAIAAALVPPIATAGLQVAFGIWEATSKGIPVIGPLLLVSINVLTIMIGSSFVLWARGMRSDKKLGLTTRWSMRMVALLMTLLLLTLIWILHPSHALLPAPALQP